MRIIKKYDIFIVSIVLAVVSFVSIYGIRVLNPLYDAWLLRGGDLTQHYIGWEFFRSSEWQFPVGLMNKIAYPNNVSVIFTDSIPVFALAFKFFSQFLAQTFQYFGWWELLCFILQAIFAVKLLYYFTENKASSVIGSMFFVFAPIFISRVFFHTALSSQWLLLVALYLSLTYIKTKKNILQSMIIWASLGGICALIHLYYIPMCGIIMVGFLIQRLIEERKIVPVTLIGASYVSAALIVVILLGGLSHDHQLDAGGLGQFSFNMNGLVNPMGWSKILPNLSSYGEGSGDGFAYLGLGVITLTIIAVFLQGLKIFRERNRKARANNVWAYCFIVVVCILVSASHKFPFNADYVFELPYPEKLVSLWGMFRSSGRFIWPVVYLILLFVISKITIILKKQYIIVPLLTLAFILQIYDISHVLAAKSGEFKSEVTSITAGMDVRWDELSDGKKHVVFVSHVTQNQDILYKVSQYAYEHDMTINDFYFAHSAVDGDIRENREIEMKNLNKDTLYIFKVQDQDLYEAYPLEYYELDGIIVGVKK